MNNQVDYIVKGLEMPENASFKFSYAIRSFYESKNRELIAKKQ